MMPHAFSCIKFVTVFETSSTRHTSLKLVIDSYCFRLHYKLTFFAMITACIVILAKQFIDGKPQCRFEKEIISISQELLDAYCYRGEISNFYTDRNVWKSAKSIQHLSFACAPLFLLAQSCLFVIPHAAWKSIITERLNALMIDCYDGQRDVDCNENVDHRIKLAAIRFVRNRKWLSKSNRLSQIYLLCVAANLINLIVQIFFLDYFLQANCHFHRYGWDVLRWWWCTRNTEPNPLVKAFPSVAQCRYPMFDIGRTLRTQIAICPLPQNPILARTYLIVWFWFMTLAIFSIYDLLASTFYLLFVTRYKPLFRLLFDGCNRITMTTSASRNQSRSIVVDVCHNLRRSECFLLLLVAKNLSKNDCVRLFAEIRQQLTNLTLFASNVNIITSY